MMTYALRRLLQAIPLLLVISMGVFALSHLAPGGPLARAAENPRVRPEDLALLKHSLGLDKPLWLQYGIWAGRALRGDLGVSWTTGEPVVRMIAQRLPATAELMLTAFLLSLTLGIGVGVVAALRRASALDYAVAAFSFVGISVPVFWLALMAQLLFGVRWKLLPVTGRESLDGGGFGDHLAHLVLPVLVLSFLYMASWSRYMRGTLIEVLSQDYVRTAWAKGLSRTRVVFRHGVRNALIPVVTIVALEIPQLFTGAIITEAIFAWPGMGRLFYDGILKGDYPRDMAILMVASFLIVVFNLIADLMYAVLDPRISYS